MKATRFVCIVALAVGLTPGTWAQTQVPGNERAPVIPRSIDAHTHFYDPHRPQGVPWPGKGDKLLYRTVLPAEFKELTKKHNVQGTIAVEASPWLEDNQWLLDLAAREPFIVGVVGRLDPASDDFPRHLARFARAPLFRGIRINHDELKRGLTQKKFLDHLRLLAESERTLDVNGGPDMPADVAVLARQIPKLRIVINHAANLTIDGQPVPPIWLKGMREAAAEKRVYCKVSALVEGTRKRNGDAPAAVDHYRPVLDALWQTFGADRLIYGSNWPVSNHAAAYATVYEIPRSYLEKRGAGAAEKFFAQNAVAAYKLVEGPTPIKRSGHPKLKTSLNAYSFNKSLVEHLKDPGKGMSLFDLLDFCAEHNFDAIDPTGYYFPGYPKPPSDAFLNEFKRRAFLLGLDISGTGVRTHFASADRVKRAGDIEHVKQWVDVAARMGAPVLRVFAGAAPQGHSWDDVAEWLAADLKVCVEHGKKRGVIIGIQNHDDFLKTGEQTVKIVKMVDSEWFGVIVDTGAFATPDPYKDIALVAPFAVNWQIKTHMPGKDGKVQTDFKRIVQIAREANYRGYLPIETLPVAGEPYDPLIRVPQALKEWRLAVNAD